MAPTTAPQTAPQTAAQTAPRQPQESQLNPHLLKPLLSSLQTSGGLQGVSGLGQEVIIAGARSAVSVETGASSSSRGSGDSCDRSLDADADQLLGLALAQEI
jgi:hypothetical protein